MECRYVLPQHYLFQLAERPPNDIPTLLNIFRAVPPVIKRRANELLDEIRAGGSRSVDVNRPRKAEDDPEQSEGSKPTKSAQSGTDGEFSAGTFF